MTIAEVLDNAGAAEVILSDGDETTDSTPTLVLDLDLALGPGDRLVIAGNGDELIEVGGDDADAVELDALAPGDRLVIAGNGNELIQVSGENADAVELDALAPGEYSLTAQVVDAAGNTGPLSDPFVLLISPAP